MAKYLFQASYTPEGAKGLLKEGGSKRREAVDHLRAAAEKHERAVQYFKRGGGGR